MSQKRARPKKKANRDDNSKPIDTTLKSYLKDLKKGKLKDSGMF